MKKEIIVKTVARLFPQLWKRHKENLALLLLALSLELRVGIAVLGRAFAVKTAIKHAIKRVDRFFSNQHFDDEQARRQHLQNVIGPRQRVLICVDWTNVRQWPVLVAAMVWRGRAIPILWAVQDPAEIYKSRNWFENAFFALLRSSLPAGVKVVLLLDRGFSRMNLAPYLQRLGFEYVTRICGKVHVRSAGFNGPVEKLARRGQLADLKDCQVRKSRWVRTRVVAYWGPGQKEPWFLVTNVRVSPQLVLSYYHKRFRIEECFRDQKCWRFGLALGGLRMLKAQRLERMLLVVAIYYFLALVVGGRARRLGLDRYFRANTGKKITMHSDFTLGKYYLRKLTESPINFLEDFYAERLPIFWG